jgi:hypothetical protein
MSNLAAVLHNLLDAIEEGDQDEIRSAAKLARMAAPTNDTEDAAPPQIDDVTGWYAIDKRERVRVAFPDVRSAEAYASMRDEVHGDWYAIPGAQLVSRTDVENSWGSDV